MRGRNGVRGDLPSVPQSGEEDMEQEPGGDRGQEGGVEGQAARVEEE